MKHKTLNTLFNHIFIFAYTHTHTQTHTHTHTHTHTYLLNSSVWFGLVWLYGILTLTGYLMPNQAAVVSILLYGCTTWTWMEKKLDGNYTRMLRAISNESGRQHPTKQQLYGHLHPITKTIKVRRTRHARHCWRSGDELISDVPLWTPSHGQARAGRLVRTYIQQLCVDTRCSPEDLP